MFTQKTTTLGAVACKFALAITLIIPMLTILVAPVQADTNVGGPIISDTTWTLANSPYIVTTSVDVQQNVTLTIEPGVTVRFNAGTKLQINGELVARGTADSLITFTSSHANPAPGDWDGIEFTDIAVPVTMDANENYISGNILQYCIVEYSGFATADAITAYRHLIDNCLIQDNHARGIWIQGEHISGVNDPGYATNNILTNNYRPDLTLGGGIFAKYSIIRGNVVTGSSATNSGGGIYGRLSELTGNTLIMNTAESGGGIFSSGSVVENNSVSNNSANSGGGIASVGGTLNGNVVSHNSATGSPGTGGGIYAESTVLENIVASNFARRGGGIFVPTGYSRTIISNTIVANEVSGFSPAGSGMYYGHFDAGGDIQYNTIVNNRGPKDSVVGGLQFAATPQVHNNTFYGNIPYDVTVDHSTDISGTHNYWGTVANVDILTQVYDWYDDADRGKFLYVPYLQEPNPDAPLPPPTGLSANFQDDSVTLTWNALPSFTAGWGYKVYYDSDDSMPPFVGTGLNEGDSPIDVGASISYTLTGLDPNTNYYFAVTVYDSLGREGWYSNVARKLGGYWIYLPLVIRE